MRTGFIATVVFCIVLNCQGMAVFAQTSASNCTNAGLYGAPACCGPGYCGPLVPGCCEYPPDCVCDHIWDGYCQEKGNGCGGGICLPCWGWSVKRSVSTPCQTTSACGNDCQVTPLPDVRPISGSPAQPAPAVKQAIPPAPAKPASPQPENAAPPAAKASSAWRFMPAGDTFSK